MDEAITCALRFDMVGCFGQRQAGPLRQSPDRPRREAVRCVEPGARRVKASVVCDALLLDAGAVVYLWAPKDAEEAVAVLSRRAI